MEIKAIKVQREVVAAALDSLHLVLTHNSVQTVFPLFNVFVS